MIVYATSGDLIDADPPWLEDSLPDNADLLLRYASILVARVANQSLYGTSSSAASAEALRDATCAQVASWVALGVNPAKAGTDFPAPVKRTSILDAKVDRDTSRQNQAIADAANGLCDLARDILQAAGLPDGDFEIADGGTLLAEGVELPTAVLYGGPFY